MKLISFLFLNIAIFHLIILTAHAKNVDKKNQIMQVELNKMYPEGVLVGKNKEGHFLSYYIQNIPIRVKILTKKKYESIRRNLKEIFEFARPLVAKNFFCQDKILITDEVKTTAKLAKRSYCLSEWNRSNRLKFISWFQEVQDIALQ